MKINLREDEEHVIQGDPADATVDLAEELKQKFDNYFREFGAVDKSVEDSIAQYMSDNNPHEMIYEHFYRFNLSDEEDGTYLLSFNINFRIKFDVPDKPTVAAELVIPKEFIIGCVDNLQKIMRKLVPELNGYPSDILNKFKFEIRDADFFTREIYKGKTYTSGIMSVQDFNSGNEYRENFRKKMPLEEFYNCDINNTFSLLYDVRLSADYKMKRDAMFRKGQVLIKHFQEGDFEGKHYKLTTDFMNYMFRENVPYTSTRFIDEDSPIPVLRAKHVYLDISFGSGITIDGTYYNLYDLKHGKIGDVQLGIFCTELSKAIHNQTKHMGIKLVIGAFDND